MEKKTIYFELEDENKYSLHNIQYMEEVTVQENRKIKIKSL